jgi:hypothetical protein
MGECLFEAKGKEVVIVGDQDFERPRGQGPTWDGPFVRLCAKRWRRRRKIAPPEADHSFELVASCYSLTETLKLG